MSELIALLPPITSGPVEWPDGPQPVYSAFRYWRTKNPRNGKSSYWHIPRSAQTVVGCGPRRVCAQLWCGQSRAIIDSDLSGRADPVCATCMGRAIGSGQFDNPLPEELIFTPRWFLPPETCPSRYAYVDTERCDRVRCLVCDSVEPLRGGTRGYGWTPLHIARHNWPGPGSVSCRPCDFHGWTKLGEEGGGLVCGGCGPFAGRGPHRPLAVKVPVAA